LLNSRSSPVTATGAKERRYRRLRPRHPFSRSYGASLPSSLTRVLSRAWVSSTRLPVSVCGTVGGFLARGFSRRSSRPVHVGNNPVASSAASRSLAGSSGFSYPTGLRQNPDFHSRAVTFGPRPPFARNGKHRCRNIDRPAIAYPRWVQLRTD
jgi:hypothetical protein